MTNKEILYKIFRSIYKKTPFYRLEQNKLVLKRNEEKENENTILSRLFPTGDLEVLSGPFKGLKYRKFASGSMLLPKIVGSYEEPLHDWIYDIIAEKKYKKIIDIGCAEGFYAVGFGKLLPSAEIIACDINPKALEMAKSLSSHNNLSNLTFLSKIDHKFLSDRLLQDALIFCDIEGYEKELLDPNKCPQLKLYDILVEVHDCFSPGIGQLLIDRFTDSHHINSRKDYQDRKFDYPDGSLTHQERIAARDEKRPKGMYWLYFKVKRS